MTKTHSGGVASDLYTIGFSELSITRQKIEKTIGYPQGRAPEAARKSIDEVLAALSGMEKLKGGYLICDDIEIGRTAIRCGEEEFATGPIVATQLAHASQAALFVCTAGEEISRWAKSLFSSGDQLRGYIADIAASEAVESAMDRIQEGLADRGRSDGKGISHRYSPGYCGWPVSDQAKLFSLLPRAYCGVTLTPSCMMEPVKSISGIIGIGRDVKKLEYPCKRCEKEDCLMRDRS